MWSTRWFVRFLGSVEFPEWDFFCLISKKKRSTNILFRSFQKKIIRRLIEDCGGCISIASIFSVRSSLPFSIRKSTTFQLRLSIIQRTQLRIYATSAGKKNCISNRSLVHGYKLHRAQPTVGEEVPTALTRKSCFTPLLHQLPTYLAYYTINIPLLRLNFTAI